MDENQLRVRASINLSGLRAGQHALVDPRDPYISELISAGYLSPEPDVAARVVAAVETAIVEPAALIPPGADSPPEAEPGPDSG